MRRVTNTEKEITKQEGHAEGLNYNVPVSMDI